MLIGGQRWLSYCGKKTLPIYVLQGFEIAATRLVITRVRLNDGIGIVPMLICTSCRGNDSSYSIWDNNENLETGRLVLPWEMHQILINASSI